MTWVRSARVPGALLAVAFAAAPLMATETPRLSVQMNNDSSLIVVTDQVQCTITIYRVQGSAVSLLTTRNVCKDAAPTAAKATPTAPPVTIPPANDYPGQDPPDFARLERSVRIGTHYTHDIVSEIWDVTYLVPGTPQEVYAKLRIAAGNLPVLKERMSPPPFERVEMHIAQDPVDLTLGANRSNQFEGFVEVQVRETRKKS